MTKREFLRLSSAVLAAPFLAADRPRGQEALTNWAKNVRYGTTRLDKPASVSDVQRLVREHAKLKPLGTRHCFNLIADSTDRLVAMTGLADVHALDADAKQVTVGGGITYGGLSPVLHEKGFALHNLASLPHISVAGAAATATHGSGVANGNLATAVTGMELVVGDGSVVELSLARDANALHAAAVHLGALGLVTKVTLAVQPAVPMRQRVFLGLPMARLAERYQDVMSAGYSVSLFTDWQGDVNSVWVKSRADADTKGEALIESLGAKPATRNLHPIVELSAVNCTEQMGVPGPWYERLPHFRMGFTPSSGEELQAEYFVPQRHAVEALQAVARLGRRIGPHLFISEVRCIAADELWMSPCYRQACTAIHFTLKPDRPAVDALLPLIERELTPFEVRPHWGKLFAMSPEALEARYEKLADFRRVAATYDPKGAFVNAFLARCIRRP